MTSEMYKFMIAILNSLVLSVSVGELTVFHGKHMQ